MSAPQSPLSPRVPPTKQPRGRGASNSQPEAPHSFKPISAFVADVLARVRPQ